MWTLAQYTYNQTTTTSSGIPAIMWIIYLLVIVIYVVALWRIFEKAGEAGWKSLIPIYNTYILLKILGYSGWYLLLFLIPIVGLIFYIIVAYKLAQAFGYGIGMTILEFVAGIGLLIMAFGDAKYHGPNTGAHQPAKQTT